MKELLADILIMLQAAGQWLIQNALLLTSLVAALGIAEWIWKPFRFLWPRIKRRAKPRATPCSIDLRFVPIESQSVCFLGGADNRLITQIDTKWYVTNASESRMPARLLKAQLLKPRVRHPSAFCYVHTGKPVPEPVSYVYSPEYEIPSGETRKVSIHFHVNLRLREEPGERLRVRFAVTDQLEKEHRMPMMSIRTFSL